MRSTEVLEAEKEGRGANTHQFLVICGRDVQGEAHNPPYWDGGNNSPDTGPQGWVCSDLGFRVERTCWTFTGEALGRSILEELSGEKKMRTAGNLCARHYLGRR